MDFALLHFFVVFILRLTCQMGIHVPEGEKAWIRVGPETRRWKEGECLLYDTTYEHETMNEHPEQDRVVLHVDFFNTLALTSVEIEVLQYIYSLREQFMKAEGTGFSTPSLRPHPLDWGVGVS